MITAKRIRLQIALLDGELQTVRAYSLGSVWAAHRPSRDEAWRVTHRRTGFLLGLAVTFSQAKNMARAILRAVPARHWQFDDPQIVKHNPVFKDCAGIVGKYGAL